MKIFMIGPGEVNELTSGLGVAADQIAHALAENATLTVIQPGIAEQKFEDCITYQHHEFVQEGFFEESAVMKNITQVPISVNLAPCYYSYTPLVSEAITTNPIFQDELKTFENKVLSKVKSHNFDCIYAHDWTSVLPAIAVKEKTGKPLIIHYHSLDIDRISTQHHSWIFDLEKSGMQQADAIVAVSRYMKERITEHYEIDSSKVHIVHNGTTPIPVKKSHIFKDKVILFVGRLTGQKGPQTFIEIAEKLLLKDPQYRFLIVGDGEMRNDLIEIAAHKKIGDRVHFTGFVKRSKLFSLFAESSVFCLPSISEPFGLAALEAASAGLPVVISKQCGVREVLPGVLTANYWDIELFARHIHSMIEETDKRTKAVSLNRESLQDLTWSHTAYGILEIAKKLL